MKRKGAKIALGVLVLLVGFRIALPYIVKDYVNKQLGSLESFEGHIDDVDINLYRGAYKIKSLVIEKKTAQGNKPFVEIPLIDFSVYWKQLFKGSVVAEIVFVNPNINFVDGKSKKETQTGENESWVDLVKSLVPIRIDRLEVRDGRMHLLTPDGKPPVDIYMQKINGSVENLTNSEKISEDLVSHVSITALAMNSGNFELKGDLNVLVDPLEFDLKSKLLKLDLPQLNTFLKHYADLDVEKGTFDLVFEAKAEKGKIDGYAKPLFKDMDILSWKEDVEKDGDNLFNVVWQAIAGTAAEILENQPKDQFATKIPISGDLSDPKINVLSAIGGVFKNAFIKAMMPWYEKGDKDEAKD